ncbi:SMI1/KNR4 family protein [Streptomyces hydrogenans]|uniref:SMI1/KNR4 family protein n=2 Tax=Streptomyces hydrogenans TaxID=1873719 RepID=UPI0035D9BEAA
MDSRTPRTSRAPRVLRTPRTSRIRSKLVSMPYNTRRAHSVCGERHGFRLGPRVRPAEADAFEAEHRVELPAAYRTFLTELGGSGAGPFHGLLPLEACRLYTMNPKPVDGGPRGFTHAHHPDAPRGDLFLHVVERGCSDLCLVAVTGPLTGRVVTGNASGFLPPNVSSARDFLGWYERWLDHLADGRDDPALGLSSPATVAREPWRRSRPLAGHAEAPVAWAAGFSGP